ncbi:MAG: YbgC/FadM family acyl-CoA thioesterase [Thermaerobacterales bacterium]
MFERARLNFRVRLAETDAQAVVYFGSYFIYFEMGQLELMRRSEAVIGQPGKTEETGGSFVIAHAECDYHRSAHLDDELHLETWIGKIGNTSVTFHHRLLRPADGALIAKGAVVMVCLGAGGRPQALAPEVRRAFERFTGDTAAFAGSLDVAVVSTNPAKVHAVKSMLQRSGAAVRVRPVSSPVTGPAQPVGDQAILAGAQARAEAGLNTPPADGGRPDLAVGMESGIVEWAGDVYVTGWCVILDQQGRRGLARSAQLRLPAPIGRRALAGERLSALIDAARGRPGSGAESGAMGFLTRGLFDRQEAWEGAVAFSLAPFLAPDAEVTADD